MSVAKTSATIVKPGRLLSLDFLRGYFIVVITLDHLWKFPSLWTFITGQAMLWVTAAEGFVIISGFLIGYVRGYKGLKLPFTTIAGKLIRRAALLYVWMLIMSMAYIWLEWEKIAPHMPYTAIYPLYEATYWDAFWQFALSGKPHMWIHFLYLYTMFLLAAVVIVALLRAKKPLLVVLTTLALYLVGLSLDIEWMKWQIIFFLPSLVGFYFPPIQTWWHSLKDQQRRRYKTTIYSLTAITLLASVIVAFAPHLVPQPLLALSDGMFSHQLFSPFKVIIAGLWFTGFAFLFEKILPWLQKYTFGVLETFGTHSLGAYIIHGLVICLVNATLLWTVPAELQYLYYTFLGLVVVLIIYGIFRIPFFERWIPR